MVYDPRIEQGVFVGRPSINTTWKDRRVRAVGSRVWFRPPTEPFHQFLIGAILVEAFRPEWITSQSKLAEDEQHPVVRWLRQFGDLMKTWPPPGARVESEGVWSFPPTGAAQCLLTLGHDLYSLQHTNSLPDSIMKRLRHPDQFQGARYEVAVGAIFARQGFKLEWAEATGAPIPEFVAVNEGTGERIAVEAKSRHRPGVLGRSGDCPDEVPAIRADVAQLLKRALAKAPREGPFVIFVDLNLPPEATEPGDELIRQLQDDVDKASPRQRPSGLIIPDPFSAIVFTNYAWQWAEEAEAPTTAARYVVPLVGGQRLSDTRLAELVHAVDHYGFVPND